MTIPVANWRQNVSGTPIFWDLMDRSLRHYGPRVAWRELERKLIGSVTLLRGTISFGYTGQEMANLAASLPGMRLAPLIANVLAQSIELTMPIDAPHQFKLLVTPSVPFPDVQFSCTVQMAAGGEALADAIEALWKSSTLLRGSITFDYEMRNAACGHEVSIDFRSCSDWLRQQPGSDEGFTVTAATALTNTYVTQHSGKLIQFAGVNERTSEREFVRQRLVEVLFQGVTYDAGTFIDFDGGEQLKKLAVHPTAVLASPRTQFYVRSHQVKEQITFPF